MAITPAEAQRVFAEAECLYTPTQVAEALVQMAQQITAKLQHSNPLVVSVLSGAIIPAGQLLTQLDFPLQIDYLHASRYQGETSGKEQLSWIVKPRNSLVGRTVLIVDDILDEGTTLKGIIDFCYKAGAEMVYSAVLAEKHHERNCGIEADFVGLQLPDRYVFGCGMDYMEFLRNVPGIYAVKGL